MSFRVLNGGNPPGARGPRKTNPRGRYTVVPVDTDGDDRDDVAYITHGRSRREGIREVARTVDDDAMINVGDTRTTPTKHQAQAMAKGMAPTTIELLARRLVRGQS